MNNSNLRGTEEKKYSCGSKKLGRAHARVGDGLWALQCPPLLPSSGTLAQPPHPCAPWQRGPGRGGTGARVRDESQRMATMTPHPRNAA